MTTYTQTCNHKWIETVNPHWFDAQAGDTFGVYNGNPVAKYVYRHQRQCTLCNQAEFNLFSGEASWRVDTHFGITNQEWAKEHPDDI